MRKTLFDLWGRPRHPVLVRVVATLLIVVVALLVRMALSRDLAQYPLLLFIPAVFLSALLFGQAMGLLATVLTASLAVFYFIAPTNQWAGLQTQVLPLAIYLGIGFLVSVIVERLHDALRLVSRSEARNALLLQELSHRIRNDLMMVTSTLSLQARSAPEPSVRAALEAAVNRIGVIAQAHERLGTRPGHQGFVELGEYLQGLCNGLGELLRDVRPIALRVVSPTLEVPSNQAAGVGLIVNELVTNALKHAFPGDMGGVISVLVEQIDRGLRITVEDNGIGCPQTASNGLGSRLVRLLASQYEGSFDREPKDQGCRVRISLRAIGVGAPGQEAGRTRKNNDGPDAHERTGD